MNKLTNIFLVGILVVLVVGFVVSLQKEINVNVETPNFGSLTNDLNASCTHSVISISATSSTGATTQALAANYATAYRRLQNVGNTMLSCQLDSPTSTLAVGTGIILYSSSSVNSIYEITPDNLYQKLIRCMAETSTGTLSVIQCY